MYAPLTLLNLPEEIIQAIAEFCNLRTRCAVTRTNSALKSVFLGDVALKEKKSERFVRSRSFRVRIRARVLFPNSKLSLKLDVRNFTESQIKVLNSVGSVFMYIPRFWLRLGWLHQLSRIKTVRRLSFEKNPISDLSFLVGLTKLTHLNLAGTEVTDLSVLAGLPNLTYLDISFTQVSDVSALAGLTNLTLLDLSNTKVSNVAVLAGLKNLGGLFLTGTQVSSVSALAGLKKLRNPYSGVLPLHDNQDLIRPSVLIAK